MYEISQPIFGYNENSIVYCEEERQQMINFKTIKLSKQASEFYNNPKFFFFFFFFSSLFFFSFFFFFFFFFLFFFFFFFFLISYCSINFNINFKKSALTQIQELKIQYAETLDIPKISDFLPLYKNLERFFF